MAIEYNRSSEGNLNRISEYCLVILLLLSIPTVATELYTTVPLSKVESGARLLDNSTGGVTLRFDVGAIDFYKVLADTGEFILPAIKGFSRSFKKGEPSLPILNKIISIPFGCKLNVEVLESSYDTLNLADLKIAVPIFPVQPSLSKSTEPAQINFEQNKPLYLEDKFYNLPLAESKILGILRSQRLGQVSFSPFEYNPVSNIIRICKEATVRVNYINPDWEYTKSIEKNFRSPFFEPIYEQIINYDKSNDATRNDLTSYPVKYLIISDRMFENQLAPFVEWKTKKGFTVVVAYTDVIGASSVGISNYIRDLYNAGTAGDPAPSFVLLVGDDEQIPAFNGNKGSYVTDLHFCEFTDDYLPEIYYGRFSAQNTSDLQPQIDKTLEYEQYLMPDPSYLEKVTLVSGVDAHDASSYGNGQINYGSQNYFNAAHGIDPNIWLYPASNGTGVPDAIIQTVDDGIGFYNYTAHCTHFGQQDPQFYTDDIAELTNIHKYLLGIANCCQANTFGDNFPTPCFGEAFLRAENKGGIGFIGASEDTYWDEDYWWAVGYGPIVGTGPAFEDTGPGAFDGVFHDHGEPVGQHYNTNAAIVMAGDLAVMESGSIWSDYYWEVYHLMGDPSVMTYFGVPTANDVTFPSITDMNAASIDVAAVPGSYVGITFNGVLHGAGYIDYTGSATIALTPFPSTCSADIVVTAQNKIPYNGTITIVETAEPYIVYNSYTINDVSPVNNDGQIDAGEPILLGLQLQNLGLADGLDVVATISSDDPYITITDDTENYGTVPGSFETTYIADAFAFYFNSNTPDLHTAAIDLNVTGSYVSRSEPPWLSNFELTIHAPNLNIMTLEIDDQAENNNGILEPGETVELILTISNDGSGFAGNVAGNLSIIDDCLSVVDTYGSFGDILSGSESMNDADRFTVTADPSCYPGYETSFTLDVTSEFGVSNSLALNIIVGGRVEIYSDDFSTNQGWSGLGGSAEWTIGPATGGSGSDTYGQPDPAEDHTATSDNYLLGNDLNDGTSGDYSPNLAATDWVFSPAINCASYNGVQLSFYRCLGIEGKGLDQASFEVFDGTSWVPLFESSATMDESEWSYMLYDVSAYADWNPYFQIRFGLGGTNGYANYCGWNIDDIVLTGYDQNGACGDVNHDGFVNIIDVVYIINYKYKGGPSPEPMSIANVNSDGDINILDIICIINFKYKNGPALNCP